jgi:hypothetical protein
MDEMKTLTELGADLHPEHGPSAQLQARALSLAPPARRRSWRPLLAVAATMTVLAAGTAIVAGGLATPKTDGGAQLGSVQVEKAPAEVVEPKPANFTVRRNVDGTITFTVTDLVDAAAATQALNTAGVAGRVVNVPDGGCSIDRPKTEDMALDTHSPDKASLGRTGFGWSESVTASSASYPTGGGLLVIVQLFNEGGQTTAGVVVYPYTDVDNIPTCLRLGL